MGIELRSVTKIYNGQAIFREYDLEIPNGTVGTIMGNSGCGKTTLLRLIAGLEQPDSGVITGVPEHIGMVFQENRLCEQLSAVDNVRLVLAAKRYSGKAGAAILCEEIERQLLQVGIGEEYVRENVPVSEYSGGMKRRVAIVRACMSESDLLLLDEPCTGLDKDTRRQVIDYILANRQERTMLVVTHDADEAAVYDGMRIRLGNEELSC